jgi:hypothetical protein
MYHNSPIHTPQISRIVKGAWVEEVVGAIELGLYAYTIAMHQFYAPEEKTAEINMLANQDPCDEGKAKREERGSKIFPPR